MIKIHPKLHKRKSYKWKSMINNDNQAINSKNNLMWEDKQLKKLVNYKEEGHLCTKFQKLKKNEE